MKDYAAMSDFEINCRVHAEVMEISELDSFKAKDYCNSPADAWPIIEQNKISLTYHTSRGHWSAIFNHENISMHGSPLRAAMIVFLMMKESEND